MLPTLTELDDSPTVDELLKAVNALSMGKAHGIDGIPPEVTRASKDSSLLHYLNHLLNL